MDIVFSIIEAAAPLIVGLISVPIYQYFKNAVAGMAKLPAWAHQGLVAALAGLITILGAQLNVVLPESVELFTQADISAILSAAIAYGVHAGKSRNPA